MSRLLFAAARGARIQVMAQDMWWHCGTFHVNDVRKLRIHPKDEHLQYGPISTALRERAETTNASLAYSVQGYMELAAVCDYTPSTRGSDWADCWSAQHRSLFLLILAEALADEGL